MYAHYLRHNTQHTNIYTNKKTVPTVVLYVNLSVEGEGGIENESNEFLKYILQILKIFV